MKIGAKWKEKQKIKPDYKAGNERKWKRVKEWKDGRGADVCT